MTTVAGPLRPLVVLHQVTSGEDEQLTAAELRAQIGGLKVDIQVFTEERDSHPIGSKEHLEASIKLSRAGADLQSTTIEYGNQLVREQNQHYEANMVTNNNVIHPRPAAIAGEETSFPAASSITRWFNKTQKWGENFLVTPVHKAVDQAFDVTPSIEHNDLSRLSIRATIIAAGLTLFTRGRFNSAKL